MQRFIVTKEQFKIFFLIEKNSLLQKKNNNLCRVCLISPNENKTNSQNATWVVVDGRVV